MKQKVWYVIQYKHNSFNRVKRNLSNQNFEYFCPMHEIKIKNSNFKVVRPLFSGYMFIALNPEFSLWNKIRNTYGVTKIITVDSTPISLQTETINDIKKCLDDNDILNIQYPSCGDKVKITSGPFVNFITKVEKINADMRIWVFLDLMNQKTKVQIHPSKLEVIN
jgi:transcriptional antiterminator RfaH